MNSSRTVRIFISSTFRDFAGERDELVKKVFPELRRRCKARFVELLEVDLRWGVTEEQSRRGETLRICLQEIDRCRPSTPVFFIGLLGERYGWIPEAGHYPKDVLADPDLQWVREHAGGKSVTELEILHGVLNNPAMAARAYFYFRKEGYQHRHWPEIQAMYPFLKPEDFGNASELDAVKQRALKERVWQGASVPSAAVACPDDPLALAAVGLVAADGQLLLFFSFSAFSFASFSGVSVSTLLMAPEIAST